MNLTSGIQSTTVFNKCYLPLTKPRSLMCNRYWSESHHSCCWPSSVWDHNHIITTGLGFRSNMKREEWATLSFSVLASSSPTTPPRVFTELYLVEPVRHSPRIWLEQRCLAASETRTMGCQERGWFVCATFIGFVASVQSVKRADFLPFGQSAGDQSLAPGTDRTHRLPLDKPVLFYDGSFDSIYVSNR